MDNSTQISIPSFNIDQPPPPSLSSSTNLCEVAEGSYKQNIAIYSIQCVPLTISLMGTLALLAIYSRNRITVHGNLLLLVATIITVSFGNSLGYFAINFRILFMFATYTDSCELLIPFWLNALCLAPTYLYFIAYPLLHFFLMAERVRATMMAQKYEGEGQQLGIWMVSIVFFLSIGFVIYVILSAFADDNLSGHLQAFFFLTSKYNSQSLFLVSICVCFLAIFTALSAWRITLWNRRIRSVRNFANYSLSRNYQLNENRLAMSLILPLDIFYAALYSIYTAMILLIRAYKPVLSSADYIFYYNLANTLLFCYSAITIVVYIRFLKSIIRKQQKPKVTLSNDSIRDEHEGKLYFKELHKQWQ